MSGQSEPLQFTLCGLAFPCWSRLALVAFSVFTLFLLAGEAHKHYDKKLFGNLLSLRT